MIRAMCCYFLNNSVHYRFFYHFLEQTSAIDRMEFQLRIGLIAIRKPAGGGKTNVG